MSRLSGFGLLLAAYLTAYAPIPLTGPQMPQGVRLLLLACVVVGLTGMAGLAGLIPWRKP